MKFVLPLMLLVMASSCLKLNGVFKVDKDLKLVHTTIFGNDKTKTVPAGRYRASFKFQSKEKVKLTFKKDGGQDISVKIKLPEGTRLPETEGAINLPASETGQRYNIEGAISTDFSRSDSMSGRESCTYTTYERRCERVCEEVESRRNPGERRRRCRKECDRVEVTNYGYHHVEYYFSYTDKKLTLEILNPRSGNVLAHYNGTHHDSSKHYTFQGTCR